MKTEQTLDLERKIWQATHRQGTFGCFEVTIPNFIYLHSPSFSLYFQGFPVLEQRRLHHSYTICFKRFGMSQIDAHRLTRNRLSHEHNDP